MEQETACKRKEVKGREPQFTPYSFDSLTARLHYAAERFRNGSYRSVNGCETVPKRTVPGGTVPPRVGGPNRSRTVPFASVNRLYVKLRINSAILEATRLGVSDDVK